jgi:hypothetical protein
MAIKKAMLDQLVAGRDPKIPSPRTTFSTI